MRETEILRGLGKARGKRNAFADGMVPLTPLQQATAAYRARNAQPVEQATPTLGQRLSSGISNGIQAVHDFVGGVNPQTAVLQNSGLSGAAGSALANRGQVLEQTLKDSGASFADGVAQLHGPGTGTSDSIDAKLSNGEAVLPAKTVQAVGPQNLRRLIIATNGQAPKTGLRAAHFAVGEVPEPGVLSKAGAAISEGASSMKNAASNGLSAAKNYISGATAPTAAATTPVEAVSGIGSDAVSPATRVGNVVGEAAAPVSKPGMLSRAVTGAGNALSKPGFGLARGSGVVGGALGMAAAGADITKNGVNVDNATNGLGSTALAVGSAVGSAPAAVGAGSFLTGKWLGGQAVDTVNNMLGDPIGKHYNPDNSTPAFKAAQAKMTATPTQQSTTQAGVIANAPQTPHAELVQQAPSTQGLADQAKANLERFMTHKGDGNAWGEGADRKVNTALATQQNDMTKSEMGSLDSRYQSDNTLRSALLGRQLGYAQLQKQYGNDNEDRINKQLDTLSTGNTGKDGQAVIDGNKRADLERAISGTYGKLGMTKANIPTDEMSEFLNLHEAGEKSKDPGMMQKLSDFVNQRRRTTSHDVSNYRAVGSSPGVIMNSTRDALGNETPTYVRHGAGGLFSTEGGSADLAAMDNESIKNNATGLRARRIK